MAEKLPTQQEWKAIYDAAIKVNELAPWQWMEEVDVFGVQHPDTGEIGFVSIMGMLGEYHSIAIYLGAEAVYDFWDVEDQADDPNASPQSILEIPQLQASFVDRKEIEQSDYNTIKKLGYKFRGKNAWPQFQSIQPGFVPWALNAKEASLLRYVLEQTVDVAARFEKDPELLDPSDDESYLVRVPTKQGESISWEDRIMQIPPPEPESIPIAMDVELLETMKKATKTKNHFEIDVFMFPAPIQEKKNQRPYFPYTLLIVDAKSSMVLGTEMMQPVPSLNKMRGLIPFKMLSTFAKMETVPTRMSVSSELLYDLLEPLTEELGIKLKLVPHLKSLEEAKYSMFEYFMQE